MELTEEITKLLACTFQGHFALLKVVTKGHIEVRQ